MEKKEEEVKDQPGILLFVPTQIHCAETTGDALLGWSDSLEASEEVVLG